MLGALKDVNSPDPKPVKEQADELQALIVTSREERGALSAMLTQIEVHAWKLSQVGKALQQVNERATGVTAKLEELTTRLAALESRAVGFEQIETGIRGLVSSLAQAEQTAEKLLKSEGELQKRRQAVQQLFSLAIQTTADLDMLKKEQTTLDQLRDRVRQTQTELQESVDRTAAATNEFEQLRSVTVELQQEHTWMRDALRQTRDEATATTEAVRDVEKKLGPLAQLNELGKTTEERLATLNSLADHVLQKVKVLENQRHTVEHAVVESNQLTEMVWNMDVQIAKLKEGVKQAAQADETVARLERVVSEVADVATTRDRLSADRSEFESFLQRVEELQRQIPELESRIDAITLNVSAGEEGTQNAATLAVVADDLERQMIRIAGHQQVVEKIDARLNCLSALSASVDKKLDEQLARRAEVDSLKSLCDGLGLQLSDTQQKLDAVSGLQQKLLPLTAQVATLKMELEQTKGGSRALQQDEGQVAAQQKRLAELMDASRALTGVADERLRQVQSLTNELGRGTALKEELVQELARLQGRQRDVATQAVIDQVVESMARLNEIGQGAQTTLKALRTEGELAERIARSITQLRARTASGGSDESKWSA
jgi:chromosome segregation ATPase